MAPLYTRVAVGFRELWLFGAPVGGSCDMNGFVFGGYREICDGRRYVWYIGLLIFVFVGKLLFLCF